MINKKHMKNIPKGMSDVTSKKISKRTAAASCKVIFKEKSFNDLINEMSPKGDVFGAAKIAGIFAAKSTSTIIPMCHPLQINKADVTFKINKDDFTVTVTSEVICEAKTGVEMESLTSASAAALTIYDMMKWSDKGIVITDLKLLRKKGGKSGDYTRKDK